MRILFTAIPTHSHIAPMLPLVDSAVHAGHEVIFATGTEGIPLVQRTGVRSVELGHTWADTTRWYGDLLAETKPQVNNADESLLHYILNVFVRYLANGMAPTLIALVDEIAPDIVISETSELAGRVAALLAGIPHVVHGFGPQQSGSIVGVVTEAIVEMQANYGIPAYLSQSWNKELYLDIWPAIMNDDSAKMFENVLPLRPASVSLALPADPVLNGLPFERTVYVTVGTMFNSTAAGESVLRKLISAFEGQQLNAIVTVGSDGDGDVDRFSVGYENVKVRRFVPQDALLPYVDAVLSHGGAGTALGALAHGVPHVMAPLATDQHRIAGNVAAAGAGLVLSHDANVQDIREAIHAAINDQKIAASARSISPALLAIPSADLVLAEIMNHQYA